jgi:hypothetical protein
MSNGGGVPAGGGQKHTFREAAQKAKKKQVDPVITPAKLTVVVKKFYKDPAGGTKPYTKPKRQKIILKTSDTFEAAGTGTFTRSNNSIRFFKSPDKNDEIKFDGKDNAFKGSQLTGGVTLYAEGAKPDFVKLTLKLSGGSKTIGPDFVLNATSVEVTLDICKGRPSPGVDPPALSQDDKIAIGRNLLVQDKAGHFERAQLVIHVKPALFTGALVVTAKGPVTAFSNEKPTKGEKEALPYTIPDASKIPAAGDKKLWGEAKSPSKDLHDSAFVVSVKDVEQDADHVVATAVQIQLDIFHSRKKAGKEPEPMSAEDKVKLGRFVHEQDAGDHHGRALLVVRKIKPEKFKGTLVLKGFNDAKIELFPNESKKPGEAARALPHEIDYDPKDPTKKNEDKKFWVQGKTGGASGALSDVSLWIHLKEDNPTNGDTILMTVYRVDRVDVSLPATPCLRGGARAVMAVGHFNTADPTFVPATDLTVVKGAGEIDMVATVHPPGVPLSWDPEQASDDAGPRKTPTVTPSIGGDVRHARIRADAEGSFHVHAFVDQNGTTHPGPGDSGVIVNLHLINITVIAGPANNRILTANHHRQVPAGGQLSIASDQVGSIFPANNSVYGDAVLAMHAIGVRVSVLLAGGGANRRRGIDPPVVGGVSKVGLGFLQNDTNEGTVATYAGGPPNTVRWVAAATPAIAAATPIILPPPPPPPALLGFPVRDHRGAAATGYGVMINSSSDADRTPLGTGGVQCNARYVDPPGYGVPLNHPVSGTALQSIGGQYQFHVCLVAFSTDFDENFAVIGDATWQISFGTFTPAGGWTNAGAAVPPSGPSMHIHNPPIRAEDAHIEHCPPGITDILIMDAR